MSLFALALLAGCFIYDRTLLAPGDASLPPATPAPDAGAAMTPGATQPEPAADAAPPVATNASDCASGKCWWSHAEPNACESAGVPGANGRPAPSADPPPDEPDIYLGFSQVRLGESGESGGAGAWDRFGFDLDGVCSSASTCSASMGVSCKPGSDALPYDGLLCRDNTFARLEPVVAKVPELGGRYGLNESTVNCELWRGSYNAIARVSGYDGSLDDPQVRVDFYSSPGLERAPSWDCDPSEGGKERASYPRWRESQAWKIDRAALAGPAGADGSLPRSKVFDAAAYVRQGYLVVQLPDGARQGFVGDAAPYRGFEWVTHRGRFVGKLERLPDDTWVMQDGLSAGVITKSDFARAFRETGFCGVGADAPFFESMLAYLEENADILSSGAVDPEQPCDALSYAFAFEAGQVTAGSVVDVPARVECCPPGATPEECSAVCGDGKLSGMELCDSAIADAAPGACPRVCPSDQACTKGVLSGSACQAKCTSEPITAAGPKDGCCPEAAAPGGDPDCTGVCGNGMREPPEQCDDGNQTAGDGCSDCKMDAAGAQCLDQLKDWPDACAQCACKACADRTLACSGASESEAAASCDAFTLCSLRGKCRYPDCGCGTATLLECAGGGYNGPCVKETGAAAQSDSVWQIDARARDTSYPIGRANALLTCLDASCAAECAPR